MSFRSAVDGSSRALFSPRAAASIVAVALLLAAIGHRPGSG